MIGTTLSHFRITAKLGEGGMGEVYLAEDTKLGREVAIKVLPDAVASDPERLARFEREAKVLASLNHPNIAAIYSFERSTISSTEGSEAVEQWGSEQPTVPGREGVASMPQGLNASRPSSIHFLVMELVDGDTLQELMARGVPMNDALEMAAQVADALEEAHEQGIVHRDLKPANVKVTPNGTVKVLDFGLAKALDPQESGATRQGLSMSPTLTAQMTQAGVLMGTAAYMSPEQARGQEADKRADIWAYGVVLWEMLTQEQLFAGDTVSDTLAEVLKTEPDLALLPNDTPPSIVRLLRRCLTRDPRQRLRDIGDARIELEEAKTEEAAPARDELNAAAAPRSRWRELLAWSVAVLGIGAALFLAFRPSPPTSENPRIHFEVALPEGQRLTYSDKQILAVSPDARSIAFVAFDSDTGRQSIFVRDLDQVDARPVPGTEGATDPAFSPDGQFLAFFADGELKRVPIEGGAPFSLAPATTARGLAWGPAGSVFYSPEFAAGILRVPSAGGEPEIVVVPDVEQEERTFRWPVVLPDGKTLIFTLGDVRNPNDYSGARIIAYSLDTGERWTLVENANMALFAPPDRLLYVRRGTLYAVSLDLDTMEVHGDPVPVIEGVGGDPSSGVTYLSAAANGSLTFVPGAVANTQAQLTLLNRDGEATTLPLPPQSLHHPRFSPDGKQLAFTISEDASGRSGDVWLYSLETEALSRTTFGANDIYPMFTPDGRWLYFLRGAGEIGIHRKAADGSGSAEKFSPFGQGGGLADSSTPDGDTVAYTLAGARPDIYLMSAGEEPILFEEDASSPEISPDGRWIAYQSPGSGSASVYVRPIEGDGKWQVSPTGGSYPNWTANGRELLYLDTGQPARPLMRVDITPGETFRAGPPRVLFEDTSRFTTATSPMKNWDVDLDGNRFAFIELARDEMSQAPIEVLLNWSQQGSSDGR
jgi:serine/threonine-protein kinase